MRTGPLGEKIASDYLVSRDYKITARNYRCRAGEVDIIAEKNNMLSFIEVKYWRTIPVTELEYSINKPKMRKILRCARNFLKDNEEYLQFNVSFDAVFIDNKREINHYKDIFRESDIT